MEQRNEPSTAKLAAEVRRANQIYMLESNLLELCADRLEAQEREIKKLTARAKSAEATLKVLESYVKKNCRTCFYHDCGNEEEPCFSCTKAAGASPEHPKWVYRGLPQEGVGK